MRNLLSPPPPPPPTPSPTGVVYFLLSYYTDRYNIYYVYRPAPYNGRQFLHRSAVNFVIVGAAMLQLVMLFFSVIRLGEVKEMVVPRTHLLLGALQALKVLLEPALPTQTRLDYKGVSLKLACILPEFSFQNLLFYLIASCW